VETSSIRAPIAIKFEGRRLAVNKKFELMLTRCAKAYIAVLVQ